MESREMLVYPRWNPHCSHLHSTVSTGLSPDGAHRGDGLTWVEYTEELSNLGWNPHCSHLHAAVSIGLPQMEPAAVMGYPRWKLLKTWATTSDEIHTAVIYMLLLHIGLPPDGAKEEMGCLGWNLMKRRAALDGT